MNGIKGKWLVIVSLLLFSLQSLADATFGAEFTFTNFRILNAQTSGHIVNNVESERHRDLMADRVRQKCKNCKTEIIKNAYGVDTVKVTYSDGFYFIIATDPSVVEIQTKPLRNHEIKKILNRIQTDIFDSAKEVGMAPQARVGGGHIHFGFQSAIEGDLFLMRNLIVDFANNSEIAMGVLSNSIYNSRPIALLPEGSIEAFKKIIDDVDHKKIRSARVLAERINKEVYNWHPLGWVPTEKYQALNLMRIASKTWDINEKTFEVRSLEAQKSAAEFELLTRLFQGRIDYIKHLNKAIELKIPDTKTSNLQMFENVSKYVTESGIDYKEFESVMNFDVMRRAYSEHITPSAPILLCSKILR